MAAAQNGDARALDQLLRRHQGTIHAVCRRLAGNDADALDAAQNALIAIVRGLDRFDGRASFTTWAYRIATNACIDELRRRGRRPAPGLPDLERPEHASRVGTPSTDPAETVVARMEIEACLARMNDDFRVPVVLRDVAGLSYDEIGSVLNLAPGTVRSRIARGRTQLADAISRNQKPLDERQSP